MARPLSSPVGALPYRLAMAIAAALYGTITVGGRWFSDRGFSLYEISLTGVLFAALLLLVPVIVSPAQRVRRRDLGLFVVFGLVGAALQLTQFAGIVLGVPVALVALLLYSQPIWTVLIGRIWLLEPVTTAKLVAVGLSLAGVLALFEPSSLSGSRAAGIAAALVAGLLLALWIVLARVSALRGNPPLTTTFGYTSTSALALLASWPMVQAWLPQPEMTRIDPAMWLAAWQAVALYTVVASILPATLAMWSMRGLDASTAGVLLLLEPVSAALLAWPLFGEAVTGRIVLGGALILGANWVLLRGERT